MSIRTYRNTFFQLTLQSFVRKIVWSFILSVFFFFDRKFPFSRWSAIVSSWRYAFLYLFISLQSPFYATLPVFYSVQISYSRFSFPLFWSFITTLLVRKKTTTTKRAACFIQVVPRNFSFTFGNVVSCPFFFQYLKRNYMALCQALEPVVSVKLKVCVEITGYIYVNDKNILYQWYWNEMTLILTLHCCKK